MWETLKNTIEASITDLRYCLKTECIPFNLIDTIETLEWIIRYEPKNQVERDATIVTIRDCLDDLGVFIGIADDADDEGLCKSMYFIKNSIYPAYLGWANDAVFSN